MRGAGAAAGLLLACLPVPPPASAAATDAELVIGIVGSSLAGDSCHLSFQIKNRLFADFQKFVTEFTARAASGREIGQGVFAAGRIRRMQPYQRVASFDVPGGDAAACRSVASVELAIESCVLEGTGDVGVEYCERAFRNEDGEIAVALAGQIPDRPARELLVDVLGIRFSDLTRELAAAHDIPATLRGIVVVAERPGPAGQGLREGDLVIEIDLERVPTLDHLIERVNHARARGQQSVLCMIVRAGERRWLVAPFLAAPLPPDQQPAGRPG